MIRMIRGYVVLMSAVSLLALTASAVLSTPVAGAASAHGAKKSKRHKKKKKKKVANKVANAKITAGTETLTFNAQAAQTLEKAKVATTAVSPATGALSSGFVFQLTGGTLNPATGLGSVTASGGITFATSFSVPGLFSSETNSTVSEPSLALNSAPTLSLTSQQVSPPTFPFGTLSLKGVHPASHAGAITLSNLTVSLTSTGAQFLNQFAANAFSTGEAVGTVTIQVATSS